jgi:hypothetical protein
LSDRPDGALLAELAEQMAVARVRRVEIPDAHGEDRGAVGSGRD